MLNNYERMKIKRLELSGEGKKWKKGKNHNYKLKKYEPNKTRIGEKVKKIRGNRTLEKFGKLIGVAVSSVSNYENNIAIPRDKVINKIIQLKEAEGMTYEEFLYGYPLEYLEDIFGGIRDLLNDDRSDFYEKMELFLINNKAYYTYEDSLISKAIEFYPSLKFSPDFIVLARLYGIEKQNVHLFNFNVNKYEKSKDSNYRYEIEEKEEFHTYIMPTLEAFLPKFDDYKVVAERIKQALSWLEFEEQKETEE